MGGKARSLARLRQAGLRVPPFFVVAPEESLDPASLNARCAQLTGVVNATFAVRSSADVEDGEAQSYAGMFDSFLFVRADDVADRIERVRASARSNRVVTYAARAGVPASETPSAIVQVMIDAEIAGVAFGRDPVDGSDHVVIGAAYGLGSGIVGGDCATDTYRVACDGTIEQTIAHKPLAHRRSAKLEGIRPEPVAEALASAPALCGGQARTIAAAVREIGARFGAPQDVEWAFAGGRLYILQARPVTTPPGIIWDNSNIAESYGGFVSPLTFSFARSAYAGAYHQFMRALAIPESTLTANRDTMDNLLGLVHGRLYYNLLNWYRLLALIPGFRLNRHFMETMMGVSEALPEETVRTIERTSAARDLVAAAGSAAALVRRQFALPRDIRRFHRMIDAALAASPPLADLDLPALAAEYDRLEACLLTNWQAPLVNDFFAMIAYGLLSRSTAALFEGDESIQHDLLCAEGGMISTEPARRIEALAALVRGKSELLAALASRDAAGAIAALAHHPGLRAGITAYIAEFGDRCQGELKLESRALDDDPLPLYRAIARLAATPPRTAAASAGAERRRAATERVSAALRLRPLRAPLLHFALAQARARVRDRENLRFERTRVFGHVRRIFTEIGRRLHADGQLADPRDIFYLQCDEIRSAISQPERRPALRARVETRRAEYVAYATSPTPPDRFTSIGTEPPLAAPVPAAGDDTQRIGTGCCPGTVRARVRVVADPQTPLTVGEILVAERTDPGWIVLFPAAAGILVERGSVLSHAAIVSREMGIPSVVGIEGLTRWLHDGDVVEFDGRSGLVRRVAAA